MSDEKLMPKTVRELICALCADYPRRRAAIESHSVTPRTENEYKYYNYKIYDAVAEVVGEYYAERFIEDIGSKVGYAKTELYFFSETAYKYKKSGATRRIAYALHLLD
jgi:hypothetical protein